MEGIGENLGHFTRDNKLSGQISRHIQRRTAAAAVTTRKKCRHTQGTLMGTMVTVCHGFDLRQLYRRLNRLHANSGKLAHARRHRQGDKP